MTSGKSCMWSHSVELRWSRIAQAIVALLLQRMHCAALLCCSLCHSVATLHHELSSMLILCKIPMRFS